jgi:antitoxin component HigA of HigAB toxin-antitoxin module
LTFFSHVFNPITVIIILRNFIFRFSHKKIPWTLVFKHPLGKIESSWMKAKSFEELYVKAKERETYLSASITLEFTEGLSELMEVNNIPRKELAKRLGPSPAYVTKVLRGDVNFTVDSMARLAKAVGGTVQVHLSP